MNTTIYIKRRPGWESRSSRGEGALTIALLIGADEQLVHRGTAHNRHSSLVTASGSGQAVGQPMVPPAAAASPIEEEEEDRQSDSVISGVNL